MVFNTVSDGRIVAIVEKVNRLLLDTAALIEEVVEL